MRWLALVFVAGCQAETVGHLPADGGLPDDDAAVAAAPDASAAADPDAAVIAAGDCPGRAPAPVDDIWDIGGRSVHVHVPASLDPTRAVPVVLGFHALAFDAEQQESMSRMNAKADAEGFIAIHAEGSSFPRSWNAGACCAPATSMDIDDVGHVAAILDEAEARLCVDPRRVYATGMSNGGFLSHRLACELSDRIAAIAPVAGVNGLETCTPSRPVPVMHFHGTDDWLVPYDGGGSGNFRSVDESIALWAGINGCAGIPVVTYETGAVTCTTHLGCPEVTLCTVEGGGHTWPGGEQIPGGGTTTMDIDATDAMWDFFAANPLPAE